MQRTLILCIALLAASGTAWAQTGYPVRPIRMVVGFPAGGGNDIVARLFGARLQEAWGQPVVVDNKPGANAIIASEFVARSAPDGYTLLVGASGQMTVNPGLYSSLPYDPVRDFAPVTMFGSFPLVFAVHPSLPANSVRELIQLVKTSPAKFNYSAGSTAFQLATELFKILAGVEIQHIPFKGSAQAINAVLTNDAQMTLVDTPPAVPQIKSGKLRGLAVTSRERAPSLPELPTMIEAGVPDYEVMLWISLFAPAATPPAIVRQLHQQLVKLLQLPDIREKVAALGMQPVGSTPEELAAVIKTDMAKWAKVAKTANVKAAD
ncbi:MAG TPA: tripartite tricarboxylate transporter substrate binding protein [Burkholderiales bacterium]|nr:tripartite tricarboxylate transporter substrate binding protein [Burkholderiales bacterium]